jgi:hypothetical protein
MSENTTDRNVKNHVTSKLLIKARSKVGVSEMVKSRKSSIAVINPLAENYAKLTKSRYLLICESCLWCASYIKNQIMLSKCPLCFIGEIGCMPIGEDKNYLIDYSHSKGVELNEPITLGAD